MAKRIKNSPVGVVYNDVATADGLHPATRMHIAESFAIDPTLL